MPSSWRCWCVGLAIVFMLMLVLYMLMLVRVVRMAVRLGAVRMHVLVDTFTIMLLGHGRSSVVNFIWPSARPSSTFVGERRARAQARFFDHFLKDQDTGITSCTLVIPILANR
jgi:hypothetical protein